MEAAFIAFILSVIYLLVFALCKISKKADEMAEYMYVETEKKEKRENKNDVDLRK